MTDVIAGSERMTSIEWMGVVSTYIIKHLDAVACESGGCAAMRLISAAFNAFQKPATDTFQALMT